MKHVPFARALIQRGMPVLLASLAMIACGQAAPEQAQQQSPPPTVDTARVSLERVEVFEQYAGRVRGAREVEVRARVDGIITQRTYVEGAYVEPGEQLFRIDPEPYGVVLARAQAERERARANRRQAERDWDRVSGLYEDDAISTRERDEAQSTLELARAELAVANTAVDSAEIELGYTRVKAPAAGVTSLEVLSEGGLANRGDLLTTITQLDPVQVRFSLPEGDALAQNQARRALAGQADEESRDAALLLPHGERYEHTGEIDFTDAGIDPATSTVSARAVFPNPNRALRPGMFVRVELRTATLDAVAVIPEEAVAAGREGAAIFVIDEENVAHAVPVELGPVVAEGQVVRSGLEAGDRIVVSGLAGLQDGVEVSSGDGSEERG